MKPPLLLDLFSGAGGSARGYADAGFEVVGVDNVPQPHYPFTFILADALEFLDTADLSQFAVIHASPPCQEYSKSRFIRNATAPHVAPKAMLISQVRERLERTGLPWVIENVEGAPLPDAIELCGSMFGLPIRRHRWFSSSVMLFAPGTCRHTPEVIGLVGNKVRGYGALRTNHLYQRSNGTQSRRESYLTRDQGCKAMGISWMTVSELCQAIPPDYTCYIGKQLMAVVESEAGVA